MSLYKKLCWITVYAVAMGYLETVVVVYLRQLYYPAGFAFPLVVIPAKYALIEIGREAATLFMMTGIAMVTGKSRAGRLAWFVFIFGVWDICYYIFLKVLLDWPASLLTWDILFLIPVPWTGPVLAPCIVALTMILSAWVILAGGIVRLRKSEGWLFLCGSLVIIFSFCRESWPYAASLSSAGISHFIPRHFGWAVFLAGEALIGTAVSLLWRRRGTTTGL